MIRKIVSASTAAIMAATMSVPAIVSYAATNSTDAFFVDCGVTVVDSIKNSKDVLVPITVDKDITISSATFSFEVYTRNSFDTATITGVDNVVSKDFEVNYENNVVTITAKKDVTIKKDSKIFDLKMDLSYITSKKNGKVTEATEILSNRFMFVKLKSLSAKNSAGDTFTMSENCLNNTVGEIITTAKTNKDASVKIDSIKASSRKVEVPVYFTGKIGVGIIGFKATKDAKIVDIKVETFKDDKGNEVLKDTTISGSTLVINEIKDLETQCYEFKDNKICTLVVEVPSSAQTGDTYDVKINHLDLSSTDGSFCIDTNVKGVITYTGTADPYADKYLRGDINLDGMVDAEDATLALKYFNWNATQELIEMGIDLDNPNYLRNSITRNSAEGANIDELFEVGLKNGDVNNDGEVDALDSTYILYFSMRRDEWPLKHNFEDATPEEESEIWKNLVK